MHSHHAFPQVCNSLLRRPQSYSASQRVKARILYVDPATKRVALSLLPHLQAWALPAATPLLGQVGLLGTCIWLSLSNTYH